VTSLPLFLLTGCGSMGCKKTVERCKDMALLQFDIQGLLLQVGETGRTVGVEHIPELVDRSILAIKQTPASYLLDKDHLNIYGNPMQIDALMGFALGNIIHCDVIQLFAFFFVLKTLSDVLSKHPLLRKWLKKVKETNSMIGHSSIFSILVTTRQSSLLGHILFSLLYIGLE
jgi:hypothetical protein